jgi:uncharacterized protein involved in outer membrane biogenesis
MRWKWILMAGASLILVLVAAVWVILESYDYNKFKPRIAGAVKDATGRELKLGGEIDLEVGFSPALVVTKVALANATWGSAPELVRADRLQAQVRLLPLLSGDVEVVSIGISGARVSLETDSAGRGNWDFTAGDRSPKDSGTSSVLDDVHVKKVRIENLDLTFREGKAGATKQFNLASLDVAPQKSRDGLSLHLQSEWNGQPVDVSGNIGTIHSLFSKKPFPVQLSGRVSNAAVEIDGTIDDLGGVHGVGLKVRASGKNLQEIGLLLGTTLPTTDAFTVQGRVKGSAKALSLHEAKGSAAQGSLRLALDGAIQDLLSLDGMNLKLQGSGKNLSEVGSIIGEKLPTTDAFTVHGRVKGSAEALSLHEAKGSAARGSLRLAVDGEIQDLLRFGGISLKLQGSGKDLTEVGALFETNLPKVGPLDVNAHLTGSAAALSLDDFSAKIDRSDFNGSVKVAFLKRPKISLVLQSSVVDLTPLMKEREKEGKEPDTAASRADREKSRKQRLFSKDTLPFDSVTQVDADFELKVGTIHARDAQLEFGHFQLTIEDSSVSIEKLEATYKQTKISGNARLDPGSPPQVAAKFVVQNFDLGRFHKEMGSNEQVKGHVDIAADVKSTGDSVQALMADLDGTVGAVMGKGYLTHYLDLISVDLSRKAISFWGHHEGAKQVDCAVVQFDVESGVATSQAFVFDTEAAILTGAGNINLGTEQVDFLLVPKPKHASLTSFATKLHVSGSITDPKVRPDKVSLAKKGVKALSALAIGPAGLLAPFVTLGAHQKHPCDIRSITQIGLKAPAGD